MLLAAPIYENKKGGYIYCLPSSQLRIFKSCSAGNCIYSSSLRSAKAQLDSLEAHHKLMPGSSPINYNQRKTTLKWNTNGELSSTDMARVLQVLSKPELLSCDFSCALKGSI